MTSARKAPLPLHPDSASRNGAAAALDPLAFWCLWAFVLALPWEGNTLVGGLVIPRWLGLILFGLAGARLIVGRQLRPVSTLHLWMLAFVAWVAISLLWTLDRSMTMSRLGSYIQLLMMSWLIWEYARDADRIAALLFAYCLGTWVSSIDTIHNLVIGITSDSDEALQLADYGRFAPQGFDQNELALLLALSFPMSFYLLTRRQSGIAAVLCWIQVVLCTTAVLLTGSRAGFLALTAASTILPFTVPRFSGRKKVFCALILAIVIASSILVVPGTTWDRLLSIHSEVRGGNLSHRTAIWAAGMEVFRTHAFLGVGAGAYGASVVKIIDVNYVAHNSFLSILVELGTVGALILLGLMSSMLYLCFRMQSPERWLWIVLLLTWSVGVSSLTWEYRKITWFVFAMLGAHAATCVGERRPRLLGVSVVAGPFYVPFAEPSRRRLGARSRS